VQAIYGTEDNRAIPVRTDLDAARHARGAFEAEYFAAPRETSLSELAEQLETSHQALSERIRRATDNLVESALITHSDESNG
jgi:hypothetical protein